MITALALTRTEGSPGIQIKALDLNCLLNLSREIENDWHVRSFSRALEVGKLESPDGVDHCREVVSSLSEVTLRIGSQQCSYEENSATLLKARDLSGTFISSDCLRTIYLAVEDVDWETGGRDHGMVHDCLALLADPKLLQHLRSLTLCRRLPVSPEVLARIVTKHCSKVD